MVQFRIVEFQFNTCVSAARGAASASSRCRYVRNNGRWERGRERGENPCNLFHLFIHSVVSILYNIALELQMAGSTVSVLGSA